MTIRHARSARLAAAVSGVLAAPLYAGITTLGAVAFVAPAHAQSTASQLEEIVVTATRQNDLDGILVPETAPKARSSITQEFIETQAAGQSIIQTLNLTPGLNFTNNDAYGSSGGNIRLRGFDGNRVSLTFDGIPLNDTGNYAVFTNQQLDAELIERANVNLGTTDVDSPTASATGGTINYITRRPAEDIGGLVTLSLGSDDYRRVFGLVDTGAFGPWGTTAFVSASYQKYDKFRGRGDLEKQQYNARLYQAIGDDGDFVSLAAHFNRNRNNNYRSGTRAQWALFGRDFDFETVCVRPSFPGTNGVADNDGATTAAPGQPLAPSTCTDYWGRQINPSSTGNIRGQSSFGFGNGFRFTFDPSFQYVLANGGAQNFILSETDRRVRGNTTAAGLDLNRDGDILDSVRVFWPSTTNTHRVGVTSSLIWDFTETQRVRVAYTYDRGRHRQTGEAAPLDANGDPFNVFGGRGDNPKLLAADGALIRQRDRYSIAELNQVAFEYRGRFFDEALTLSAGVRVPQFKRELNQYCFSQNGSSAVRCTTEPVASTLPNGNVTLVGAGTTQFIAPYSRELEFDGTLPNFGAAWEFLDNHSVFLNYAQGFSAPRTDNLYTVTRLPNGQFTVPLVQPERTRSWDLGYRYDGAVFLASASVWQTDFTNRIVSSFDDVLGVTVDRNVGKVEGRGIDGQIGWRALDTLRVYGSASYNDSEVQSNVPLSATLSLPTAGKTIVETPDLTLSARTEWDVMDGLQLGLQAKYVGERWATDINDELTPSYTTVDFDARYEFAFLGFEQATVQFNVTNLTDKFYFGSISSRTNAITVPGSTGSSPTYQIGAPRTFQVSFRASF